MNKNKKKVPIMQEAHNKNKNNKLILLMGIKSTDYIENKKHFQLVLRRIFITIDNIIAPLVYFLLLNYANALYYGESLSILNILENFTTDSFLYLLEYIFCLFFFWRTYYNNDSMPFWRNFRNMYIWKAFAYISIVAIVVFSICYVLPVRSHEFAISSPYIIGIFKIILFIFITFIRRFFLISDNITTFTKQYLS